MNREMRKFKVYTECLTDTYTEHEVFAESKEDAIDRVHDRGEGTLITESEKDINWDARAEDTSNE